MKMTEGDKKEALGPSKDTVLVNGFKGLCHSCGQYGHKSADCPNKSQNEGKTVIIINRKGILCTGSFRGTVTTVANMGISS